MISKLRYLGYVAVTRCPQRALLQSRDARLNGRHELLTNRAGKAVAEAKIASFLPTYLPTYSGVVHHSGENKKLGEDEEECWR